MSRLLLFLILICAALVLCKKGKSREKITEKPKCKAKFRVINKDNSMVFDKCGNNCTHLSKYVIYFEETIFYRPVQLANKGVMVRMDLKSLKADCALCPYHANSDLNHDFSDRCAKNNSTRRRSILPAFFSMQKLANQNACKI
ncbi:uncharacterized protein LOC143034172 [Oratosquilla oratoria]|uniref:uncharacterized protein LOC143034172 n=1 Tax=Oratosquilla oratoria TaxID=337810 RepID=UPI003F76C882